MTDKRCPTCECYECTPEECTCDCHCKEENKKDND